MKSVQELAIMPTLPVFRTQPIIQVLQNKKAKDDIDVAHELSKTPFVKTVLHNNLASWAEQAKEKLAAVLGYPQYRHISEKKLHPTERLTARFVCTKCSQVGKKRAADGCLDFQGVCGHRCARLSKKQKAKEEWKAEQFLPDEKVRLSDFARISTSDGSRSPQAIKAVKVVLELIKVSEEDPVSLTAVEAIGNRLLCSSCTAPIVMDFSCVVRIWTCCYYLPVFNH